MHSLASAGHEPAQCYVVTDSVEPINYSNTLAWLIIAVVQPITSLR